MYGYGSVYAADLDEDNDIDVLFSSELDNKLGWYKNEGNGSFGEQQIITTNANGAKSVYAADLDNDGSIDVLSASAEDDKIAWYKNEGGGNFEEQRIITTKANEATAVYAADLDNDGKIDVLSASHKDDKIAWYKNYGNENFGSQQIITTDADGVRSVYAADLDNDGDVDVLSASYWDDKIAWYENLLIEVTSNMTEKTENKNKLLLYPNPCFEQLTIEYKNTAPVIPQDYQVYNVLGQMVLSGKLINDKHTIDTGNLSEGIYFLRIGDLGERFVKY